MADENFPENIPPKPVLPSLDVLVCRNCGAQNAFKSNYCRSCGKPLQVRLAQQTAGDDASTLNKILGFFIVLVVMLGVYGFTEFFDATFEAALLMDALLAAVVVGFSITNRKELIKLLKPKTVKPRRAALFGLIMVVFAIGVHLLAGVINRATSGEVQTTTIYDTTAFPFLFSIIFIGIYPAIFEELAFRGFLFNYLLRFTNAKTTVIVTGVLFAFVHFAFISLLWHIPIGLFFGYMRIRYRSLWYSMICHFVYNTTIVVIDYFPPLF